MSRTSQRGLALARVSGGGVARVPRDVARAIDNAEYNGIVVATRVNARAAATGLAIVQTQNLTSLAHAAAALDEDAGAHARALIAAFVGGCMIDISRL